jgi:hypothetical protein
MKKKAKFMKHSQTHTQMCIKFKDQNILKLKILSHIYCAFPLIDFEIAHLFISTIYSTEKAVTMMRVKVGKKVRHVALDDCQTYTLSFWLRRTKV